MKGLGPILKGLLGDLYVHDSQKGLMKPPVPLARLIQAMLPMPRVGPLVFMTLHWPAGWRRLGEDMLDMRPQC